MKDERKVLGLTLQAVLVLIYKFLLNFFFFNTKKISILILIIIERELMTAI